MKIEKTSPDEGYVTVTEEEFLEQIAEGLCCQEVLKPGRNRFIRGGFRKLHPNFDLTKATVRYEITLAFPPDIYNYFKQQAEQSGAKSMAAMMEKILIEAAQRQQENSDNKDTTPEESLPQTLSADPQLIEAVAERVRKLSKKSSTKPVSKAPSAAKPRRRAA